MKQQSNNSMSVEKSVNDMTKQTAEKFAEYSDRLIATAQNLHPYFKDIRWEVREGDHQTKYLAMCFDGSKFYNEWIIVGYVKLWITEDFNACVEARIYDEPISSPVQSKSST